MSFFVYALHLLTSYQVPRKTYGSHIIWVFSRTPHHTVHGLVMKHVLLHSIPWGFHKLLTPQNFHRISMAWITLLFHGKLIEFRSLKFHGKSLMPKVTDPRGLFSRVSTGHFREGTLTDAIIILVIFKSATYNRWHCTFDTGVTREVDATATS